MTISVLPIDAVSGSPSYTAQDTRQTFAALLAGGTTRPVGAQSGVVAGHSPTVTASSATWSVGLGAYVIDPAFTTTQGAYLVANDAAVTGAMTAANATLGRYDILYLQVNDTAIDSSGSRNATISYLAGTASGSPALPSTPARSALIAWIFVPASGTGSPSVTMNPVFAVSAGAVLPVSSAANRSALVPAPYEGMVTYRMDSNQIEAYDGSIWRKVGPATACRMQFSGSSPKTLTTAAAAAMDHWDSTPVTGNFTNASTGCTVTYTGTYLVSGCMLFTASAAGRRGVWYQINGTQDTSAQVIVPATAASGMWVPAPTRVLALSAGDVITLTLYQDSGGSLNVAGGEMSVAQIPA